MFFVLSQLVKQSSLRAAVGNLMAPLIKIAGIVLICFHYWDNRRSRRVFLCFYSAICKLTSTKFQTFVDNSRTVGSNYQGCGSGSGGSGKFLWKRKLEAVNGYRFRFHLRCSTILALNVFLTQNKQLKHTITRVCEASCCRKYPLLNSQKFESTAVC